VKKGGEQTPHGQPRDSLWLCVKTGRFAWRHPFCVGEPLCSAIEAGSYVRDVVVGLCERCESDGADESEREEASDVGHVGSPLPTRTRESVWGT